MDQQQLKNTIEAALFAAGEPVTIDGLFSLFEEEAAPAKADIRQSLQELTNDWADKGVELKEVSSGYRFQVRKEMAPSVSRLWEERTPRYSRALLETLALIAYRQPITRGEIEEIRGVSVSTHIMKTLQDRSWVRIVGHRDVPGKPAIYASTREFLDYFNLKGLDDLPSLAEIRDLDKINEELELNMPGVEMAQVEAANKKILEADIDAEIETETEVVAQEDTVAQGDIDAQGSDEIMGNTGAEISSSPPVATDN